jgi:tetraacyldisaccharide 4'-kinase
LVQTLSTAYGAAAAWRRRWYARHAGWQRRLERPVISVGNLRVGGTGKTPIVAHLASVLVANGERPAILTRGYGRRLAPAGVTIVSDGSGSRALADVDSAGDEPLMLARAVPGAIVAVGADRYLSGRLAELKLGATVHILDDGFQHFQLARDADLLVTSEDDLGDRPLPAGRLREPLAVAVHADAAIVDAGYLPAAERVGRALGVPRAFLTTRLLGPPRMVANGDTVVVPKHSRVFATAGIARPDRFFADLTAAEWHVVGTLAFRDHHQFSTRDIEKIAVAARSTAAAIVLTTEKDGVRFAARDLGGLLIAAVPLTATIEPADAFRAWLFERLGLSGRPK